MHDPELAVLDEPFSGLDPLGVESMAGMLAQTAATGVAVLFSSHQLDLVEDVCQDVVIIDHGRIVLGGGGRGDQGGLGHRSLDIRVDGEPMGARPSGRRHVTSEAGRRLRVLVDASVDLEEILADARRAGEVTAFSFEPPSLADLFLEAVSEGRRA